MSGWYPLQRIKRKSQLPLDWQAYDISLAISKLTRFNQNLTIAPLHAGLRIFKCFALRLTQCACPLGFALDGATLLGHPFRIVQSAHYENIMPLPTTVPAAIFNGPNNVLWMRKAERFVAPTLLRYNGLDVQSLKIEVNIQGYPRVPLSKSLVFGRDPFKSLRQLTYLVHPCILE